MIGTQRRDVSIGHKTAILDDKLDGFGDQYGKIRWQALRRLLQFRGNPHLAGQMLGDRTLDETAFSTLNRGGQRGSFDISLSQFIRQTWQPVRIAAEQNSRELLGNRLGFRHSGENRHVRLVRIDPFRHARTFESQCIPTKSLR